MDLLLAYNPASMARHAYQSEGAIFPIFGILFVLVLAGVILAYSYEEITKRLTPHFHEKTVRRIAIFLILAELVGMVYIDRNHTHMIGGLAKAAARAKEAGKFSPKKVSAPRTHSFQGIPLVTAGHGAKFPRKGWFGLGGSTAPQITLNDGLGGLKSFDIFDPETGQLVDFGSKKELKAAVQELERYEIPDGYAEELTYPIADARAYYERKLRLFELAEEWDRRKEIRDVVSGLAEARQQGMPLERYAASWAEYGPGNMPEALVAAGYDLKKVEAAAGRPINFEDPEYRDYLKDIIGPRDVNVSLREDVAPLIRIPDELSEARDRMGYLIYGISDEIPDSIELPDTHPSAHFPPGTPLLGGADLTADAIRNMNDAQLGVLVDSLENGGVAPAGEGGVLEVAADPIV